MRKEASWLILENVLPLNNMDADVNRFPADMLLNSGCELQTDSWPLMQNNLILSMLPRVDSSDLVTTLPQHEQCFKSEAKLVVVGRLKSTCVPTAFFLLVRVCVPIVFGLI